MRITGLIRAEQRAPAVISYLPMAEALWRALAFGAVLSGCAPDREADRFLPIRAHFLNECPVAAGATLHLEALGDFDATGRTSEPLPVNARGKELGFPANVRAITARASDATTSFIGVGQKNARGEIDFLLYPEAQSCAWFRSVDETYPRELGGQSIGISRAAQLMLLVGGNEQSTGALTVDLGTGEVVQVTSGENRHGRADATVTEFEGGQLLVAGGTDPTRSSAVRDDAQVFDPVTRRFAETLTLEYPRWRHGAIALERGRVLLVGGEDENGGLLASLEAVSPATRSTEPLLENLDHPRRDPVVLKLSDGRIFVGGGSDQIGPVTRVEWFTADGARRAGPRLDLGFPARAFAALPGGGVLAVGDAAAAWITPEGTEEPIPLSIDATDPVLVAASDGAPLLFSGPQMARTLHRFAPWEPGFEPVTSFSMPLLPGPGLPLPVALDAGALAFLTREPAGPVLIGFRHDTRGDFARDEGLVEEVDPRDASRPFHLVPDRPPIGTGVSAGELRVTYSKGVLELHSGSVFVPDTSYEDLELEIFVRSGPPPIAILGSRAYGATDCTWPRLVSVAAPGELLRVLRRGQAVVLERSGEMRECTGESGRLSIGLRWGGNEPTVIESISPGRKLRLGELKLE